MKNTGGITTFQSLQLRHFSVFISYNDVLVGRWFGDGIFRKGLKRCIAGFVNGKDHLHSERS